MSRSRIDAQSFSISLMQPPQLVPAPHIEPTSVTSSAPHSIVVRMVVSVTARQWQTYTGPQFCAVVEHITLR